MPDFLQDYLHEVPQGLDSLLSLIPAKNYYVEDAGDTWNKPKQTKAEAAAARRAKLDPESKRNRNVKEQWEEEQKNKRKADELDDDDTGGDEQVEAIEGIELERPGEGLKKKAEKAAKKQKTADVESAEPENEEQKLSKKAAKEEAKKEAKKAKKAAAKEKRTEKKKEDEGWETEDDNGNQASAKKEQTTTQLKGTPKSKPTQSQASAPAPAADADAGESAPESEPQSPTFDTTEPAATSTAAPVDGDAAAASTPTSVSSAAAPSDKPKHIKVPADTTALRARLAAKIESLRAARHADGPDGKPVRTRQELIEMRRKKQAQRKEHKQELRKQAKLAAEKKREEALASNSPSVMSPAVELDESGFSFGRVAFGDGTKLSHDLGHVLHNGKKKGPSDPKTALLKVQNARKRLEEMDEAKRKDIEDKDAWLNARRRVEGEKVRDDEAILKKAVKRKEVQKKKSEKAWKERAQGVQKAQHDRQKKREANLRQRREEKNAPKGKKKKKAAAAAGGAKKSGRPGFEGVGFGGKKK